MRRVVNLYQTSVGKKILMAASGLLLFGFIVGHMTGNLKMLQGCHPAEAGEVAGASVPGQVCGMDTYAEFLREVGYPLVPHGTLLWGARLALLGAVMLHMFSAFQLWSRSRAARPQGYAKGANQSFSYASRTMRWGGVILLLFIVYHILHMTTGTVHPDFEHGAVYANYIAGFQNPLVFLFYVVAQLALCFHLYHGLWSVTQTLGANHPKYNGLRRPVAIGLSLVIFIGFLTPPVLVLAGVVS